uniref:Uncharacterized protein n=1 Tax=Acrobeloides nanus TaxID=290746 RepID=A0A914CTL7_9BILA
MNEKEYVDVADIYEDISTSLGKKKNLFLKALEVSTKNRAAFISSSGNRCAEPSDEKAKGKAALVAITVEKESIEDFEDEFGESFSDSISDEFMNKARLLFEEHVRDALREFGRFLIIEYKLKKKSKQEINLEPVSVLSILFGVFVAVII